MTHAKHLKAIAAASLTCAQPLRNLLTVMEAAPHIRDSECEDIVRVLAQINRNTTADSPSHLPGDIAHASSFERHSQDRPQPTPQATDTDQFQGVGRHPGNGEERTAASSTGDSSQAKDRRLTLNLNPFSLSNRMRLAVRVTKLLRVPFPRPSGIAANVLREHPPAPSQGIINAADAAMTLSWIDETCAVLIHPTLPRQEVVKVTFNRVTGEHHTELLPVPPRKAPETVGELLAMTQTDPERAFALIEELATADLQDATLGPVTDAEGHVYEGEDPRQFEPIGVRSLMPPCFEREWRGRLTDGESAIEVNWHLHMVSILIPGQPGSTLPNSLRLIRYDTIGLSTASAFLKDATTATDQEWAEFQRQAIPPTVRDGATESST